MKKMVSVVGIGAMVIALGLGSGFAQQQPASGSSATPVKQADPVTAGKETPQAVKPVVAVTPEKGAPSTVPAEKAKDTASTAKPATGVNVEKAEPAKPVVEVKPDKGATAKPAAEVKPEKAAPAKTPVEKTGDKGASVKSGVESKSATALPAKSMGTHKTHVKAVKHHVHAKTHPAASVKTSTFGTGEKQGNTGTVK